MKGRRPSGGADRGRKLVVLDEGWIAQDLERYRASESAI
jgi:hypothetical protein